MISKEAGIDIGCFESSRHLCYGCCGLKFAGLDVANRNEH
jgi:hypothetical protein